MNLTSIAKTILLENEIKVDDLSQDVELSEHGLEFLKGKVEKLNQKAVRWGVPQMEIKVSGEREEPVKRNDLWGREETVGVKKFFSVKLLGDAPHVDGYTFIGKVQHTTGGENILNISPSSPIKNLPEIYRTAKGECDVCNQTRERFNTFVLRLDKEDKERFPDKQVNDLIQVGMPCLQRFLPGISVDALMHYAQLIEELRQFRDGGGGEWDEDEWDENPERGAPNPHRSHMTTDLLLKYIALVYSARGKYVPKSKAGFESIPTAEEALDVLWDVKGQTWVRGMVQKNPSLINQADELASNVSHWMKQTDFNALNKNAEWANYYGNLNVVAHANTISTKNIGYLGGVLQTYLRSEREKASAATQKSYVGKAGEKIHFNGMVTHEKSIPSQYQRGAMITIYEFEDLDGNLLKWFSSKNLGLKKGERYPIVAKVKKHDVDPFTKQPTTYISNGKIEAM